MGPAVAVCVAEVEGGKWRVRAPAHAESLAEVLTPVVGDAFLGGGWV